jgi:hypothetical protein
MNQTKQGHGHMNISNKNSNWFNSLSNFTHEQITGLSNILHELLLLYTSTTDRSSTSQALRQENPIFLIVIQSTAEEDVTAVVADFAIK